MLTSHPVDASTNHSPWIAITGQFEFLTDESLREQGRARFHGAQIPSDPRPPAQKGEDHLKLEVRWVFIARRNPWCLSVISTFDTLPPRSRTDAVIWTDNSSVGVDTFGEPKCVFGVAERIGTLGLATLLRPELVPLPDNVNWSEELQFSGQFVESKMEVFSDIVTLAADYYEVEYDSGDNIITSVSAVLDREPAMVQRITNWRAVY